MLKRVNTGKPCRYRHEMAKYMRRNGSDRPWKKIDIDGSNVAKVHREAEDLYITPRYFFRLRRGTI